MDNGIPIARQMTLSKLMIPIILEGVLRCLMGTVNVLLMSFVSDAAVGSIGIANQYIQIITMFVTSVTAGCVICVTQAVGMENKERAAALATTAIAINAAFGIIFGLLFTLGGRVILSIMTLDPEAFGFALVYMRIVGGCMLFTTLSAAFSNLLRIFGHTRMPLVINIAQNVMNIIGTCLIVFNVISSSVPVIAGVGIANVVSQFCAMAFAFIMLLRAKVGISVKHLRPLPLEDIKLALSLGIPNSLSSLSYGLGQLVTTSFISSFGTLVVTAKVYVQSIVQYSCLLGLSAGQAGQVIIGYRIGEWDVEGAKRVCRRVITIGLISNFCLSLVCVIFRRPLLGLFTQDPAILKLAASVMVIDLFVEMGRALNNTVASALIGVGDIRFSMIVNLAGAWLVSVGMSYVLGVWAGLGLFGMWIAFALDEATRGLTMLSRWRSGNWMFGAQRQRDKISATK